MTNICPLCNNPSYLEEKRLNIASITDYWKSLGINVSHLTPNEDGSILLKKCLECSLVYSNHMVAGDANFYDQLAQLEWYYSAEKWEFNYVLEYLYKHPPENLLEVGCGSGVFLEKAINIVPNSLGLEINQSAIETALKRNLSVSNIQIDDLDQKFDTIVSFQVLEHVEKPGELIASMLNKLNDKGTLIIAVPDQNSFLGRLKFNFLNMPPHHLSFWGKQVFETIAKNYSLNLIDYVNEPLSMESYIALRDDYIRQAGGRKNLLGKIEQKLSNIIMKGNLVRDYLHAEKSITGHTQIAVLKK
jgi:cyclopropane fatty-acyl-phospholipid synthase-like methyltransferase